MEAGGFGWNGRFGSTKARRTGCDGLLFDSQRCDGLLFDRCGGRSRLTFDDLFQEGFQGYFHHGLVFVGGTHACGRYATHMNPFGQTTLLLRQGFDQLDGRDIRNLGVLDDQVFFGGQPCGFVQERTLGDLAFLKLPQRRLVTILPISLLLFCLFQPSGQGPAPTTTLAAMSSNANPFKRP